MKTTIHDVARRAGVSTTTVSHVMTEGRNRARYAPATVQRVLRAAERLRYSPSRRAHNMCAGTNRIVSMFSSMGEDIESPYGCMIFTGAALAFQEVGYAVEIVDPSMGCELSRVLRNTDGVIFCVGMDLAVAEVVRQSQLPTVRLNVGLSDPTDCVEPDDRAGMQSIGAHVLKLGYERVIYVRPRLTADHPSIRIRETALAESIAGLTFGTLPYDVSASPPEKALQPLIRDLQRDALSHTVLVAYADNIRLALQQVLYRAGLAVPRDIGIASGYTALYDRTTNAGLQATGATYRVTDLGAAGARMMLERIRAGGASVPSVLVPETFVEGTTTCSQRV